MPNPVITIAMPFYNSAATLELSVRSLLNQSYDNFELLLCDDGSDDQGLAIARSFDDPRVICWSDGQRRRLALARLAAAPAPVWLLDEPAAALDGDGEARLDAAIATHCAAGGSVAVATHQPIAITDATTLALDAFATPTGDPLTV